MQLFGLAGWKRSGKTELMTRLLPVFGGYGLRVSAIKEARRDFDIDQPGKDSFLHRVAGAAEVMLASSHRWALMQERRGRADDPRLAEILDRLTPVDLVLVEGFRHEGHKKLEIHRASIGKKLLAPDDATIVAVASDTPFSGLSVPVLDIDDTAGIAELIVAQCGLASPGAVRQTAGRSQIRGGQE
jgi:molybdopterin-guanine dinucleotide biosynthesis protein B